MRRKDREITDEAKIDEVISDCQYIHLGFNDEGKVYIVPMNFGFEKQDGKRYFYFHGAKEGRKIDLIKTSSYAAFEMENGYELVPGVEACNYSARFKSVIGEGNITFIEDIAEKREAILKIMHKYSGKSTWAIPDLMLKAVCVYRMEVTSISCKEHK